VANNVAISAANGSEPITTVPLRVAAGYDARTIVR
jgi:hypothetical protein